MNKKEMSCGATYAASSITTKYRARYKLIPDVHSPSFHFEQYWQGQASQSPSSTLSHLPPSRLDKSLHRKRLYFIISCLASRFYLLQAIHHHSYHTRKKVVTLNTQSSYHKQCSLHPRRRRHAAAKKPWIGLNSKTAKWMTICRKH